MPMLLIKCPKTGKSVATGVTMEKSEFQASPSSNYVFVCSACKSAHNWGKSDVLPESLEPSP